MRTLICVLVAFVSTLFRSRLTLQLENAGLRHQLTVYQPIIKRPRISTGGRILWSWLSRHWRGWRNALVIVQPGTVIAWQRKRFRDHWAKLCKQGRPGRPPVSEEIRALIRKMSEANTGWGVRHGVLGSCVNSALMLPNRPWKSIGCEPKKPPPPT
ncbi:MAG: helix-turn-helix domain-containing protein [Gammaproteobacteria bacterium]